MAQSMDPAPMQRRGRWPRAFMVRWGASGRWRPGSQRSRGGRIFGLSTSVLAVAAAIGLLAGVVKGTVGFAMPMILISGLGSILPAETALAVLIVPTFATNMTQALRHGWRAAQATGRRYWRLLAALVVAIAITAQFVTALPEAVFFMLLGGPITLFAVSQLLGGGLKLRARHRHRVEVATGAVAGFFGGLSGVWSPPVIAFLIATGADKRESVRVQGVVYFVGAIMLLAAHLRSGVLNSATLPLSVAMLVPTGVGLAIGFYAQDRLDHHRFRMATLAILAVAGLNLVRRALWS